MVIALVGPGARHGRLRPARWPARRRKPARWRDRPGTADRPALALSHVPTAQAAPRRRSAVLPTLILPCRPHRYWTSRGGWRWPARWRSSSPQPQRRIRSHSSGDQLTAARGLCSDDQSLHLGCAGEGAQSTMVSNSSDYLVAAMSNQPVARSLKNSVFWDEPIPGNQ